MSKYTKSVEALPANLHIWSTAPTQTGILETKTLDIYPTSTIEGSDVLSFYIPPLEKLMLENIDIVANVSFKTAANGNIGENVNVSTVPHLSAALWRNVDFIVGTTNLCQSFANSWTMGKFWSTVMSTPQSALSAAWNREGFLLDEVSSKANSENLEYFPGNGNPTNQRGHQRAKRIQGGHTVQVITDIGVSLVSQPKLLPPNLPIRVNLTKNSSGFILLEAADGGHKVNLEKVWLRCTFAQPTDVVLSIIEERLAHDNAIYHADKQILSFHTLPQGAQDVTIENLFTGTLPYRFLIGVQDRSAFGSTRNKNVFSLHPIMKAQLFVNGSEHFAKPLDRTTEEYGVMLDSFLKEMKVSQDSILCHSYQAYPAVGFDLTADKSNNHLNLLKSGSARLSLELEGEAANVVLMVLAWYEQIVEISKDREVTVI